MHILLAVFACCWLLEEVSWFKTAGIAGNFWGFFRFSSVSRWFPTADWFWKVLSGDKASLINVCSLAWHGGPGGRTGRGRHDTFLSYPQCVVCFDILQASLSPCSLPKGAGPSGICECLVFFTYMGVLPKQHALGCCFLPWIIFRAAISKPTNCWNGTTFLILSNVVPGTVAWISPASWRSPDCALHSWLGIHRVAGISSHHAVTPQQSQG